jgi:hydroxyacylglutathione hydrolase
MFQSLNKLKNLPGETKVYCGHEYTFKNLEFCLKFNPNNDFLKKKKDDIKLSLKNKKPTIPSTIADEIKANIFFRVNDPDVKKAINLENSPDIEIFTKLRDLKDNF